MTTKILSDSAWYKLQQNYFSFDEITPDVEVYLDILNKKTSVNLTFAHQSLKKLLRSIPTGNGIIVISNIEVSKQPLERIIKHVQACYDKCEVGVYVALLSYFITPVNVDPSLPVSYSHACAKYFKREFAFANMVQNLSQITDYPIYKPNGDYLEEGSNFLFVHPNIRYWLWK